MKMASMLAWHQLPSLVFSACNQVPAISLSTAWGPWLGSL